MKTKVQRDWNVTQNVYSGPPEYLLTICSKSAPTSGPAESGVVEQAGRTCQTDGLDVVCVIDWTAELHEGDVIVVHCGVVISINNDLGHGPVHLINIRATLSLPSKIKRPFSNVSSGFKEKGSHSLDIQSFQEAFIFNIFIHPVKA